jgi:hypothetical protein
MLLAEILAVTYTTPPVRAQAPEPKQLTISILEGEGAINNIRQRTAREAIVQVQDENHKPVAGVAAIGGVLATRGGSSTPTTPAPAVVTITAGDAHGGASVTGAIGKRRYRT